MTVPIASMFCRRVKIVGIMVGLDQRLSNGPSVNLMALTCPFKTKQSSNTMHYNKDSLQESSVPGEISHFPNGCED